ncbi:MAG: patatin-like phospholipase family protein [Gemmobacter sp.]
MLRARVTLALQGGGAHGAFTWGVLDRLLEEEGLEIAGVSGTSAGALNAAVLKAGLAAGGREAARAALDDLWRQVARLGDFRLGAVTVAPSPAVTAMTEWWMGMLPVSVQGLSAQLYSPYQFGALWHNPLEELVRGLDWGRIDGDAGPVLHVSATNVRTGKIRVFSGAEVSPEVLLASACLPTVFKAVEIDGEAYWDGGYSGNPALFPLYAHGMPGDLVIVQVIPLRRDTVPTTAADIQERITEIGFNAPLLRDLRAIAFVRRLIAEGRVPRGEMKNIRVHMIADDPTMNSLTARSKMSPSPRLLYRLRRAGRAAADRFITDHGAMLGNKTTVDLAGLIG